MARACDALTTSDVAKRCGCAAWKVRRIFERGILPAAKRIGLYRVFEAADVPRIRTALIAAGYLPKRRRRAQVAG